jgi:hypothetical protein
MLSTVVIKGLCYFYCRLIPNSSVQALAQDAITDVVFNTFSIIFPLVGFYAKVWWLDALGGLLLSFYVIFNWSKTSSVHVRNLCGAAATADERNVLLYLTMRFAKTIRYIQNIQAYHAGDKLNVEVDIVLDENTVSYTIPSLHPPIPHQNSPESKNLLTLFLFSWVITESPRFPRPLGIPAVRSRVRPHRRPRVRAYRLRRVEFAESYEPAGIDDLAVLSSK